MRPGIQIDGQSEGRTEGRIERAPRKRVAGSGAWLVALLLALFVALPAHAEEPQTPAAKGEQAKSPPSAGSAEAPTEAAVQPVSARPPEGSAALPGALTMPTYRPPSLGSPARTVGGGSRGPGDGNPALYVLVPDHVGRTTSAQPVLFWYIDDAPSPNARIDFILLDEEGIEPLVQATVPTPQRAGVFQIALAEHGVELQPGVEYEWSVALVRDPDDRAKDIVSTGYIDRVPPGEGLDARLREAPASARVDLYAQAGLWYDALGVIGGELDRNAADPGMLAMRASLLRQVGLDDVVGDDGL